MNPIRTTFIKFIDPGIAFIICKSQPLSIQFCPETDGGSEIIPGLKYDPGGWTQVYCISFTFFTRIIQFRSHEIGKYLKDAEIPECAFQPISIPYSFTSRIGAAVISLYQQFVSPGYRYLFIGFD